MGKINYLLILIPLIFGVMSASIAQGQPKDDSKVHTWVDIAPKPIGGLGAFFEYTSDNFRKPVQAKQKGVKGKVFVQFVVEKDGKLSNIKVVKGIGCGCDEAVINLLKKSPKWKPGKLKGRTVRVRKTMSIDVN